MSIAMHSSTTLSLSNRNLGAIKSAADNTGTQRDVSTGMSSTDILRGQKAVEITHNGLVYRLQATRLGKLILTK